MLYYHDFFSVDTETAKTSLNSARFTPIREGQLRGLEKVILKVKVKILNKATAKQGLL